MQNIANVDITCFAEVTSSCRLPSDHFVAAEEVYVSTSPDDTDSVAHGLGVTELVQIATTADSIRPGQLRRRPAHHRQSLAGAQAGDFSPERLVRRRTAALNTIGQQAISRLIRLPESHLPTAGRAPRDQAEDATPAILN